MNETFHEVLCLTDLPVGRIRAVRVEDRTIAISRTAAGVFATDNTCPHRGGPLAEGDLIGEEIICPWHLWGFDVRTGLCPGNGEFTIATHEVRLEGDRIMLRLSPVREQTGVL
jgi:nitrite reductase (NADH) small subunit